MTESPIPTTLIQAVLWRRLDERSLEHGRLLQMPDGYLLDGRVLTVVDGRPAEAHYAVLCDRDWSTLGAHAQLIQGTSVRRVQLRRDQQDQWWRDEERLPSLDGIRDVDLAITPATNTLPIRRLALAIGESQSTDAAWVQFPSLAVERLPQRYTREAELLYRYESRGGAFTAELQVDEHGVVVRYGSIWERVEP
jgi:hypothetical protein